MATAAIMIASAIAMSAIQTSQKNRAAERQQAYADEAAERRIQELRRQQGRADVVAMEEKSDTARQADINIGRMIAVAADGGQTASGLARLAAAEAAVKGVDIARIESNRVESAFARRAESTSIIEENAARSDATRSHIQANNLEFFSNSLGAGLKYGGSLSGGHANGLTGTTPGTGSLSTRTSSGRYITPPK